MKNTLLVALLLASTTLTISGAASGLTEGERRAVAISGAAAGTARFFYARDLDGPTGSCVYEMLWESPYPGARAAPCVVRELKMIGQTGCLANRLCDLTTSVAGELGCWGFDQYGLVSHVTLALGESVFAPTLSGLAVFATFPFFPEPITIE